MNNTNSSTQADIVTALETIFREFVRVATSTKPRSEYQTLFLTKDLMDLGQYLEACEPGVNLGAAFEMAATNVTTYKPQSQLIEAQLDLGRMAMRHIIELADGRSLAKSRAAGSEDNLRGALAWLDQVRESSSPLVKPTANLPTTVAGSLTPQQKLTESDLALEIAELFRETLRSMSANDPRGAMIKVMQSYTACKNLVARINHNFYYFPILEQALDQFKTPEGLEGLVADRFELARAGLRLLATMSDPDTRRRGRASRLARDTKNFDAKLAWLSVDLQRRP